jgi:adenine-specific DNA glycosylase
MLSFPSSKWLEDKNKLDNEKLFEGLKTINKPLHVINHTFSHFKLILNIYSLKISNIIHLEGEWIELNEAFQQLPSLMKKVAKTII